MSFSFIVLGQNPCGPVAIPSPDCLGACLGQLNFNGTLPSGNQNTQVSCGILNNPHWYAFKTPQFQSCRTMLIQVESQFCQNGDGIQLFLFKNCGDTTSVACATQTGVNSQDLAFTPEPNKVYYLAVDGFQADICSYRMVKVEYAPCQPINFIQSVCSGPISPSDDPAGVCLNCEVNQFAGNTGNYTASSVSGFCGTIENDQWVAFMAKDTQFTITATAQNCQNGDGLQLAIYPSDFSSSPIACSMGAVGSAGLVHQMQVSAIKDKPYHLMIDGYAGDVCDFQISVSPPDALSMGQLAIVGQPQLIGEDTLCGGEVAHYRINGVTGAINMTISGPSGCLINGQALPVTLFGAPTGFLLTMPPGSNFVDLQVTYHNPCNGQSTMAYPLKRIYQKATGFQIYPDTIVCNAQYTLPWGQVVTTSGLYTVSKQNPGGCDSLFQQTVTLLGQPIITSVIDTILCSPQQGIMVCGQWLQGSGEYFVPCGGASCNNVTQVQLKYFSDYAELQEQNFVNCSTGPISLATKLVWQASMGPITHEWVYPSGQVVSGDMFYISTWHEGTYIHRVSALFNGTLCTAADTVLVPFKPVHPTYYIDAIYNCQTNLNDINLTWQGGMNLSNVTWVGPGFTGIGPSISAPFGGYYDLFIDELTPGCDINWTVYINPVGEQNQINARVYLDVDQNCVLSAADTPLPNVQVNFYRDFSPYPSYEWFTEPDGSISGALDAGNYLIETPYPYTNCPLRYEPQGCDLDTDMLTVLVQNQQQCSRITGSISTPLMRPCIDGEYAVFVQNTGDATTDVELTIELDPHVEYLGADITPQSVQGQVLRFTHPNVNPSEIRHFEIDYRLDCNAPLGQVHCTKMTISPEEDCLNYTGPKLQLQAECIGDSVIVHLTNASQQATAAPHAYFWFSANVSAQTIANGQGQTSLQANEVKRFAYLAGVDTFVFVVEQSATYPFGKQTGIVVSGCNVPNAVTMVMPTGASINPVIDCLPNVNSYDPNDKRGLPAGIGDGNYIDLGSDLQYIVRFQNTGTAPAFQVEIRDTLPPYLDIQTLETIGSSHPFVQTERSPGNVVHFKFFGINLPDSLSNEPGSHGFVAYRVKQRLSNPEGVRIQNRAGIYFDQNPVVLTNYTLHTNGIPKQGLVTTSVPEQMEQLVIKPNPAQSYCMVERPNSSFSQSVQLSLTDIHGQVVVQYAEAQLPFRLPVGHLTSGVYFVQLINKADAMVSVAKLVKY